MEYRIRVRGHLDPAWSSRLAGAEIAHEEGGTCLLSGRLPDQAALHALLVRLINLSLPLLSLATSDLPPNLQTGTGDH